MEQQTPGQIRVELRAALVAYLELLRAERVRFTGGVLSALGLLDDDSVPDAEALRGAAQAWGSAFRGAGTLGDLVLDRDTFEERRAVDEHAERLKDAVQDCLARGWEASRG
ncbi:MAG: hypothetical protein JWM64_80 [Frankiales bacterium]|nr:hypothetical protein [Frankiales bacterium]